MPTMPKWSSRAASTPATSVPCSAWSVCGPCGVPDRQSVPPATLSSGLVVSRPSSITATLTFTEPLPSPDRADDRSAPTR